MKNRQELCEYLSPTWQFNRIQQTPYQVPTNPMAGVCWHIWHPWSCLRHIFEITENDQNIYKPWIGSLHVDDCNLYTGTYITHGLNLALLRFMSKFMKNMPTSYPPSPLHNVLMIIIWLQHHIVIEQLMHKMFSTIYMYFPSSKWSTIHQSATFSILLQFWHDPFCSDCTILPEDARDGASITQRISLSLSQQVSSLFGQWNNFEGPWWGPWNECRSPCVPRIHVQQVQSMPHCHTDNKHTCSSAAWFQWSFL